MNHRCPKCGKPMREMPKWPGFWRCPKCQFTQVNQTLAPDGIGADAQANDLSLDDINALKAKRPVKGFWKTLPKYQRRNKR